MRDSFFVFDMLISSLTLNIKFVASHILVVLVYFEYLIFVIELILQLLDHQTLLKIASTCRLGC